MSQGPLGGRRVLVTRPEGRGQRLAQRLRELGATVDLRATIAFEAPRRPEQARETLGRLAEFDWVVFTSPTGVRSFLELRGQEEGAPVPSGTRIAAIGRGTGRALESAGLPVGLVSSAGRSEGLADALLARCESGARVLIVRPEVARDVLPAALEAAGLRVTIAAVYRTVASREAPAVARDLAAGLYHAAVFTSPSTFGLLLEAAGPRRERLVDALRSVVRVAIGEVTAAALADASLPADGVAATPDEEAIADTVTRLLSG